ncbi:MAG: nicotinamide-nucleotide amidohydrolase family protein, partial [Elusimicrobia bacterium]|nr:nicotinamide-nucleotide amidohydrolase family protein [Elusimicrobiota bacterium]
MRAEIIFSGNELLSRKTAASFEYLADYLALAGISLSRATLSSGDASEFGAVIKAVFDRSDLILIIRGSFERDYLIREAIEESLQLKFHFSRKAMENVARYFALQGKEVPVASEVQAEIPEGAQVLENRRGSAPGIIFEKQNKLLIVLPAGLNEIEDILKAGLYQELKTRYGSRIIKKCRLHFFGISEHEGAEILKEIIQKENQLDEGIIEFNLEGTPEGFDFIIILKGRNEILIDKLLQKMKNEAQTLVGDRMFGEDGLALERTLGRLLGATRLTLSVAESCTGGLLSSRITDAPGSSLYFKQGAVVYSSRAKIDYLGLNPETIKTHGAVSEETASEMARKIKEKTGSDCALAV